jgi:hypothetical protein
MYILCKNEYRKESSRQWIAEGLWDHELQDYRGILQIVGSKD